MSQMLLLHHIFSPLKYDPPHLKKWPKTKTPEIMMDFLNSIDVFKIGVLMHHLKT